MYKKLFAWVWLGLVTLVITWTMFNAISKDPTILYCIGSLLIMLILAGLAGITIWAATILTVDKND